MCRTPAGNALRLLLAPADRPTGPGDHRGRSHHRPVPQRRADARGLLPIRGPIAGAAPRARSDHRRMDLQPPRAARPKRPARSDRVPRDLVSPPLQDPQSLGRDPLRHDHPVADAVPGRPRRGAVDLPAGGPLRAGVRPRHAGPGRAGGPRRGLLRPGHGVGVVARRSRGALVGGDLAGGDRRRSGGDGSPPPSRPGGPAALLAGAGRPVLGGPQAGAGGGPRRADVADPRPGVLPRGGHGDGVGLRPQGAAAGDGLPGADARAGPGDLVAAVDGLDRGGVAGPRPGRCLGWPTSPTGGTTRPDITAGCSSG